MAGLIVVRCRRPGFRRAGLAHPARAEYPAGFFTAEQLAQLRAEPMLDVRELAEGEIFGGDGAAGSAAPGAPDALAPAEPEGARVASSPANGQKRPASEQAAEGASGVPSVPTDAQGEGAADAAPAKAARAAPTPRKKS